MNLHLPFVFLLQAADSTDPADAAEAVQSAVSAAGNGTGFFDLIWQGGPLAQAVLLVLLVFSVLSWAIAVSKFGMMRRADRNDKDFIRAVRRIGQLAEMNAVSEKYRPSPLVTVFEYGYEELARQVNSYGRLKNGSALERALMLGGSDETTRLQRHMAWLATTASATPFIGLFGTVWGVLDAFQGLGTAGGATLRAVAPGIADALIATAFGLFAAIPALIFFNYFSQRVREFRTRMDDFSLEFFNLAERSYGESDGVLEEQRTAGGFDRRN
jgi:biopolymer transport protein TolQ